MFKLGRSIRASILALVALSLPCSLMAGPIVIKINDIPDGPPSVEVEGAPNGYYFFNGDPEVVDPAVEEGGSITLFGVDQWGAVGLDPDGNEYGWRFTVPNAPDPGHAAVDIVWITHDGYLFGNGDLQISFDSALPGIYYGTPPDPHIPGKDYDAGDVTGKYVTLYADDTLVLQFKPGKYRLKN
jgi:hypothetical protein